MQEKRNNHTCKMVYISKITLLINLKCVGKLIENVKLKVKRCFRCFRPHQPSNTKLKGEVSDLTKRRQTNTNFCLELSFNLTQKRLIRRRKKNKTLHRFAPLSCCCWWKWVTGQQWLPRQANNCSLHQSRQKQGVMQHIFIVTLHNVL